MALVSEESVHAAADEITERGEKVTWTAVRDALGGGSPNTVLGHLRGWRAQRAASLARADAPMPDVPELDSEPLPAPSVPEVTEAVNALVHAVAAATIRIQGEERRAGEARLNVLAGSHAEHLATRDRLYADAVSAMETRLSDAEADADAAGPAIAEAEALRGRVTELDAEVAELGVELAAARGDLASVRAALAEAVEGRAVAVAAAEHAGGEAREWKAQLERVQAELASARRDAGAAATAATAMLDAVRAELAEASAAARVSAARVEAMERDLERERAEIVRLREHGTVVEANLSGLMDRILKSTAFNPPAIPAAAA